MNAYPQNRIWYNSEVDRCHVPLLHNCGLFDKQAATTNESLQSMVLLLVFMC